MGDPKPTFVPSPSPRTPRPGPFVASGLVGESGQATRTDTRWIMDLRATKRLIEVTILAVPPVLRQPRLQRADAGEEPGHIFARMGYEKRVAPARKLATIPCLRRPFDFKAESSLLIVRWIEQAVAMPGCPRPRGRHVNPGLYLLNSAHARSFPRPAMGALRPPYAESRPMSGTRAGLLSCCSGPQPIVPQRAHA